MRQINHHIEQPRDPASQASLSNTALFSDNHTARSRHDAAIWKAETQHRRSLTFRERSRAHLSDEAGAGHAHTCGSGNAGGRMCVMVAQHS